MAVGLDEPAWVEIAVPEALDDVPAVVPVDEAAGVSTSVDVGASTDEATTSAEEQPNVAKSTEKPRIRSAGVAFERAKTTSADEDAHGGSEAHEPARSDRTSRTDAATRRARAHERTTNGRGLLGGAA